MGDAPLPLWLACPEIPRGSIGWRMGYGEDISQAWHEWFARLSEEQRNNYFERYPPPAEWRDWCEFTRKYYLDMKHG